MKIYQLISLLLIVFSYYNVNGQKETYKVQIPHHQSFTYDSFSPGLVLSPNGKLCASVNNSGVIYIWDIESGEKIKVLHTSNAPSIIRFSPNGKFLASGNKNHMKGEESHIEIWDIQLRKSIQEFSIKDYKIEYISFSSNGKQIASSAWYPDNRVIVWDIESGKKIKTLEAHNNSTFIQFHPNKMLLASGSAGAIEIWDTQSGKVIETLNVSEETSDIIWMDFSQDGKYLAMSSPEGILIWDFKSNELINTIKNPNYPNGLDKFIFSPDGKQIVSLGERKKQKSQKNSSFKPNPQAINIWDIKSGKRLKSWQTDETIIHAIRYNKQGELIALVRKHENTVEVWEIKSDRIIKTLKGGNSHIGSFNISQDGKMRVATYLDSHINIWDVQSGLKIQALEGGNYYDILKIAFQPNKNTIASIDLNEVLRIRDIQSGKYIDSVKVSNEGGLWFWGWVGPLLSLNGELIPLPMFTKRAVKIWDIQARSSKLLEKSNHGKTLSRQHLCISPDNKLFAGVVTDFIQVWDIESGKSIQSFKSSSNVERITFSPNSKLLALANQSKEVIVWNPQSGNEIIHSVPYADFITNIEFSPDSKKIAIGSQDGAVKILDLESKTTVSTLKQHTDDINDLSFSSDGSLLASAGLDGTVKIWNAKSGKIRNDLKDYSDIITDMNSVQFSPNDKLVIAISHETIRVWDVNTEELLCTFHSD